MPGECDGAELARRLRMARAYHGLTLARAADLARVSQSALSLYEHGEREPGALALGRLAMAYGVSVDWLCGLRDGGGPGATRDG